KGGVITNTATETDNQTTGGSSTVTTGVDQDPSVSVVKTAATLAGDPADGSVADHVGQEIDYTILVTNTGNEDLTGVTVVDSLTGHTLQSAGTLAAGTSETLTDKYFVTQADLDKGGVITNTATETDNQTTGGSSTVTTGVDQDPSVSVVKTAATVAGDPADGNVADHVGQEIDYTILVTNTGNEDLTGVTVVDSLTGHTLQSAGTLAAGTSETLIDKYFVTQQDLNNGGVIANTATETDNQSGGGSSTVTTTVDQDPSLAVTKTFVTTPDFVDQNGDTGDDTNVVDHNGQLVTYTITVKNTGNTTLTGVTVADTGNGSGTPSFVSSSDGDPMGTLAPGEIATYTASFLASQADIDSGAPLADTATVTTTQGIGGNASTSVNIDQDPSITLTKTFAVNGAASGGIVQNAGDIIHYTVVFTNTGNETITAAQLHDTFENYTPVVLTTPTSSDGNTTNLDVGATWTFKYNHVVTQGEIDSNGVNGDGTLDNVVTVTDNQNADGNASASVTVVENDFGNFTGPKALTKGFWGNHELLWNGISTDDVKDATNLQASGVIVAPDVLPNHGIDASITSGPYHNVAGVLLGDLNGNGQTDPGETTLFIPLTIADAIMGWSVSGDIRISMLQQAIASQLNIDNNFNAPNPNAPADMMTDAVLWLTGKAPFSGYSDGSSGSVISDGNFAILDNADVTIKNGSITGLSTPALNAGKGAWSTMVNVLLPGTTVTAADETATGFNGMADGQGVQSALVDYNQGQLVVSSNGKGVGWWTGSGAIDVHSNTLDHFWLTLHQVGAAGVG
ncbi:MAG: hypothetical protein KGO48_11025, partial [Alphaproteobacteria bacterium]|nr:hypothetical protein [Alphaproteobacteria bacterium]